MATWGAGYQPGGAWQRAMTFKWLARIGPILAGGNTVPFEGQMRIAFIREAFAAPGIGNARIVCADENVVSKRCRTCAVDAGGFELGALM